MSKALVLVILFCIVSLSISAALISYWDFNTGYPTSGNWSLPISPAVGSGSLNTDFTIIESATGSNLNLVTPSLFGKAISLKVTSQTMSNDGKYVIFEFSTEDYQDIQISYASFGHVSGYGFSTQKVWYSIGTSDFILKDTITESTSYSVKAVDFSDISALDDQTSVRIKISYHDTLAPTTDGYNRVDNIQITGEPISTLPVEFSGMSVTPGTNNNAFITWTTQSETGVNGFYVLRGCSDLLSEAAIISPLIPAANTSTTQTYFFADDDLPNAGLYYYWLQSLDYNGEISYFGSQTLVWSPGDPSNPSAHLKTGLSTIYPNPFNPSLTIAYALDEAAPAQIMIYNLRGQAVHSLDMGRQIAGEHKYVWNGKSDRGDACPSGVYRIVLHAGKVIDSRKVLLLK